MTYYSTLREAYDIDSFKQVKKTKKKPDNTFTEVSNLEFAESFMNDYSPQDDCYYKNNYKMDTGVCPSVSNFSNGPQQTQQTQQSQQSQQMQQTQQKSQQLVQQNNLQYQQMMKNEKAPANVETSRLSLHSAEVSGYQSHQMNNQGKSCSPLQAPTYQFPISDQCKKDYERTMKVYTNDLGHNTPTYDEFNKQNELNNIQPYYDEDLEQYFDFGNLKDAINYKPAQLPNDNKLTYTDNNTNDYSKPKNKDDNLLLTNSYNLSEDDKKNALQALKILTDIETKIKKTSPSNVENMHNQYMELQQTQQTNQTHETEKKKREEAKPKSNDAVFLNNVINLGLFIFIGIVIILLCDQITEVAIQIGMKRTMIMMQPYLQKQLVMVPQTEIPTNINI